MATFLNKRKMKKQDSKESNGPAPEVNANKITCGTELGATTIREDKENNNTTEYEYMRSMFADLMSTMPLTPVPERPGQYGLQPQGADACHLISAANQANVKWSKSFIKKDSKTCAGMYMPGALMEARPNGIIFGRALIEMFWSSVHSGDPGPIRYTNVRMRCIDNDTVTFSSDWSFNTMSGSIYLEKWRRQPDGGFLLDEDRFHIKNIFPSPRIASPEEVTFGLQPVENIREVMSAMAKRIVAFNNGDVIAFMNFYSDEALQTVDPVSSNKGRENIRKFFSGYITNRAKYGNGVLTYNNFAVKTIDLRTAHISGDWDLGGRDNPGNIRGYVNIQRWIRQSNDSWIIDLDDFTMEPTPFLY